MLFNIQNMCERRIEIILERFEVKIDGNYCKNRSMLHIGGGFWEVSIDARRLEKDVKKNSSQ